MQQHWVLKNCRLLDQLPVSELTTLEQVCRHRQFRSGETIYLPIDRADAVLVLLSGQVKLCHITPEGKESILGFVEAGEIFGELCLLDAPDREELAVATLVSTIVLIPQQQIQQLMLRYPELAMGVTRLVGLRRMRIERRLRSLLFRSSRDRLIQLLQELATDYGRGTPDGIEIRIRLSHQDLASIIGSTRETVTNTLGDLQAEGLVTVKRRQLVVKSLAALSAAIERTSR